jgi:peptide-methionine (R)-S-oxide reductase
MRLPPRRYRLAALLGLFAVFAGSQLVSSERAAERSPVTPLMGEQIPAHGEQHPQARNDAYWRKKLDAETYYIMRQDGTEWAGTGEYNKHDEPGIYYCASSGIPLYSSEHKFDSGTSWPSFFQAIDEKWIKKVEDRSHGMVRVEIRCAYCDGHLGHVFNDGPPPTGLRHCVNSAALRFFPTPSDGKQQTTTAKKK